MSTAGPNSTSSVTSTQVGLFETVPWSNPGNATASDDAYATVALATSDESYALRCTGFGFTSGDIPSGATIDGILVEVEVSQDGDAKQNTSPLVYSGSQLGGPSAALGDSAGNSNFTPDGTDTYWPLGGPIDTASASLTQAMVVDSSFGIDLYFGVGGGGVGSNVSVDHVRMTVYYTVGGAFSLTADSGSFAVTGTAVALKRGRKLAVGSGSFALTGQTVALKQGRRLAVGSGAFTLAGQALAFLWSHRLVLGSGSFSLTGQAVTLSHGRPMTVGSGAFTLNGSAVSLLKGSTPALGSGSFALTGQALAFIRFRSIALGSGAFVLSGQAAGLDWGHRLSVGSGSFALAGQALNFALGRRIVIGSGSFTLTGQALAFARTKRLLMGSGSFTFTGSAVTLRFYPPLAMGSGQFVLAGMRIGPFPRRPDVVRVFVPAEAPRWFTAVARSIERELRSRRLLEVGEAADLPDVAEYRSRMINVVGLGIVAVSNGTNWIRLDTGATL